jgi:cytochrome c-type biogenesis protein CcmH
VTAFWLAAALLTLLALVLLLRPLWRPPRLPAGGEAARALRLYRDQIEEVERDRREGAIGADEAAALVIEIKRRMLAAAASEESAVGSARGDSPVPAGRALAMVVAAAVLLAALVLYLTLGSPEIADQPLAGRTPSAGLEHAEDDRRALQQAVAQLEARLAAQPQDIMGWQLLGRSYRTLGRPAEAAEAFRRAENLGGGPALAADLGEALIAAGHGRVSDEAKAALERALAADPKEPRARYYLALRRAQDGDVMAAVQGWVDLIAVSPPDAPWRAEVEGQIARAAAAAAVDPAGLKPSAEALRLAGADAGVSPIPSGPEAEAIAALPPEKRRAVIAAMVERLAARLSEHPGDREGWLKLARAYEVLGDDARAAEARARAAALPAGIGR